jgi:hypothetical protein
MQHIALMPSLTRSINGCRRAKKAVGKDEPEANSHFIFGLRYMIYATSLKFEMNL